MRRGGGGGGRGAAVSTSAVARQARVWYTGYAVCMQQCVPAVRRLYAWLAGQRRGEALRLGKRCGVGQVHFQVVERALRGRRVSNGKYGKGTFLCTGATI